MTRRKTIRCAFAPAPGSVSIWKIAETGDDGGELLEKSANEPGGLFRIAGACRSELQSRERRFGDVDQAGRFTGVRLAEKAQDGPTNGFDQLCCSRDGIARTIVCKKMQPPTTVIDGRQVLGTRYRERT